MSARSQPVLYSVDLTDCRHLALLPPDAVVAAFSNALVGAGATVVQSVSHNFPGKGLTSVLILAESHAALHTWPESGTVHIDIFACSPRLDSASAIRSLGATFGAAHTAIQEILRADGHGLVAAERS